MRFRGLFGLTTCASAAGRAAAAADQVQTYLAAAEALTPRQQQALVIPRALSRRPDGPAQPRQQSLSVVSASGNPQDDSFGLIDRAVELVLVEEEKSLERGMPDALVAIHEGMILDE